MHAPTATGAAAAAAAAAATGLQVSIHLINVLVELADVIAPQQIAALLQQTLALLFAEESSGPHTL